MAGQIKNDVEEGILAQIERIPLDAQADVAEWLKGVVADRYRSFIRGRLQDSEAAKDEAGVAAARLEVLLHGHRHPVIVEQPTSNK